MPGAGLMQMPPVSKVRPLPTKTIFFGGVEDDSLPTELVGGHRNGVLADEERCGIGRAQLERGMSLARKRLERIVE